MNYTIILIALMGVVFNVQAQQTPWKNLNTSWTRHTIDASSRGADGVKVVDANGDGLMDIVTGWEEGGVVQVYLHPGTDGVKRVWPKVVVGKVPAVEDAVFIRTEGGGRYDIVSAAEGEERTLYLHTSPSNPASYLTASAWTTRPIKTTRHRMQWMFSIPFDVDGNGTMELIAAGKHKDAEIGWLDSLDPDAAQWHSLAPVRWVMSIIPRDIDGDGDLDIVYTDRKGAQQGVYVLYKEGKAAFSRAHRLGGEGAEVMFMAIGNVNDDSDEEIVVATKLKGILVLHQTEEGQWAPEMIPYPEGVGSGKGVALGDLTGDGRSEIVLTTEHAGEKYGVYYLERHHEDWQAIDIGGLEGTKFDRIELLDNDGDLDLLTCEEAENLGVIWYENPVLD